MSTFVVTGSSRGLGAAIAENFINKGNHVVGISRSGNKLLNKSNFYFDLTADIASEKSVKEAFAKVIEQFQTIDGVVHAAAITGPLGSIEKTNYDAWRDAVQVNLMGTYNVIRETAAVFRRQNRGHFVAISGGGATSPMPRITAYAATKSATVRLVESVARDFDDLGNVTFNSVAPGIMKTEMIHEIIAAGPEIIGHEYFHKMVDFNQNGKDSIPKAVELVSQLVSGNFLNINGRLISAVWDDWRNLHTNGNYAKDLNIHTLRRVVEFEQ